MSIDILSSKAQMTKPHISEFRRVIKVMFTRGVVVAGVGIVIAFIFISIFAPLLAPYDPNATDLGSILTKSSMKHPLGTDQLGRDLLSRLIYGTRISFLVGISGVSIAGILGMGLGLAAGYFGGWVNTIIMRLIDALLALPPLILMLAISAILGGGLSNVLIAIGIGMMPTYCRLMCAQVTILKERDYILALRIIGVRDRRIMLCHLLPNAFPPLLVLLTTNLGTAILMEASLSFLGIGILPPIATWGAMVFDGQRYLFSNPLVSFAPGIAILLVVLAFNMVGDGLRDALDPRLRGTL